MKKRRAWSTLDEDVDEQESAALAASVAAAKDTAARSGAFLSSVKEDLTDHQRWLNAQSAAVKRDRERHERWLQRQQDLRLANAKKDRIQRHRRLVRQRAFQAIRQAFVDLYVFVRSWIVFGAGKVAGALRAIARMFGHGITALARWFGEVFAFAGRAVAHCAQWSGSKIGKAARGAGAGVAAGAAWSGSKARASVQAGGKALTASSNVVAARAGKLSQNVGRAIGSGLTTAGEGVASGTSATAAKAAALGATSGRGLARAGTWTASRLGAIPSKLFIHTARLGREVQHFARVRAVAPSKEEPAPEPKRDGLMSIGETLATHGAPRMDSDEAGVSGPSASVHVFKIYGPHRDGALLFGQPANDPWPSGVADEDGERSPKLDAKGEKSRAAALAVPMGLASDVAARTGSVVSSWARGANERSGVAAVSVRRHAKAGSVWLRRQTARSLAAAQAGVSALARAQQYAVARGGYLAREKGFDLSHMMIIAGAVFLVLGGLLIGGGFLLRSTSESAIAAEPSDETFSKITWRFHQPELALPERAVFTLSGTPESFLINGISIAGVNNSGETLTDLEAVLSSDVQRPDLRLEVKAGHDNARSEADGDGEEAVPASSGSTMATVPPGAAFRLSFQFPPEATGSADGISVEDFFDSYGGLLLRLRYAADGAEKSITQYLDPEMLKAQLDEVAAQAGGS